jgi:hypothetical protein
MVIGVLGAERAAGGDDGAPAPDPAAGVDDDIRAADPVDIDIVVDVDGPRIGDSHSLGDECFHLVEAARFQFHRESFLGICPPA